MNSFPHNAMACLKIELGLDEEFFGQGINPQFACQIDCKEVTIKLYLNFQGFPVNSRLEHDQGGCQLLFDLFDVGRQSSVELTNPKIQHGAKGLFVIGEGQLPDTFIGKVPNRIEKPLQVAQDAGFVALQRYNPLCTALLSFVRLIVGETIKQARLQAV